MTQDHFPWEQQAHKTTVVWPEITDDNPSLWLALWAVVPAGIGFGLAASAMWVAWMIAKLS